MKQELYDEVSLLQRKRKRSWAPEVAGTLDVPIDLTMDSDIDGDEDEGRENEQTDDSAMDCESGKHVPQGVSIALKEKSTDASIGNTQGRDDAVETSVTTLGSSKPAVAIGDRILVDGATGDKNAREIRVKTEIVDSALRSEVVRSASGMTEDHLWIFCSFGHKTIRCLFCGCVDFHKACILFKFAHPL